jgi:hypothetical protein
MPPNDEEAWLLRDAVETVHRTDLGA